ncbi:DUF1499 domain-containing protein [Thioalkalivibrio sp. XN279]|uniref:DUF1499 domain-containing protein n=1 Tax=Thioalkalivibrio sp. XN279 TaxID=2714953 RepID=UPI00140D7408|nr:DUF1499 domain-containing protein [Thioalkalivibrio sp. XN279]NHA16008.1 DUF1499 domain-containing protein [Thioalkalivibrio sp. XN279]
MNISRLPLLVALLALLMLLFAGPGTRLGLWEYGTGFLLMRGAFFAGAAAAALALLFLVIPRTRRNAASTLVLALVVGSVAAWVPWNGLQTVRSLPFIHDITTDTVNPPVFVAVLPLRADAANPPEYPGEEVAQQQREAYPEVQPLLTELSTAEAFDRAEQVARELGWEIVVTVPQDGRIEATDTTFWFGFKDDVVIRVRPTADGSRVDIRSKSRVGRSDVGANAARIEAFLEAFEGR